MGAADQMHPSALSHPPAPTLEHNHLMYMRALEVEEWPAYGRMVVVSPRFDAVYWLGDRHARLHQTPTSYTVALEGPGRHLLKAPATNHLVTFEKVKDYYSPECFDPEAAWAFAMLNHPDVIQEVLFPPYIADLTKRPRARHLLPPPDAPWQGDKLALLPQHRLAAWCWDDPGTLDGADGSILYGAPVLSSGAIHWGKIARHRIRPGEITNGVRVLEPDAARAVWQLRYELSRYNRDEEY
ncbi:hypothetical protein [Planomonospora sp. ID82291]|uniref:hypothetical protein n=1 Tax=Planomonospora sp. ID82291 TaxID=2738136 RepID=UPI0018C3C008|nr:hypothetical protein [Planomonospora sp. ID82291]MBG0818724.1 hypothetical protein [Planomonospora sp. ID82291]